MYDRVVEKIVEVPMEKIVERRVEAGTPPEAQRGGGVCFFFIF